LKKILFLLWLCGLLLTGSAPAADWKMDPAGSKLEFVATFEKAGAPGEFKEFDAPPALDLTSPPGAASTSRQGHERRHERRGREQGIRGKDWFDYAAFRRPSSTRPSCAASKAIATWRAASCC